MEDAERDDSLSKQKLSNNHAEYGVEDTLFQGVVMTAKTNEGKQYIFQLRRDVDKGVVGVIPEQGSTYEIVLRNVRPFQRNDIDFLFFRSEIRYPTKTEFFEYQKLSTV